MHCKNPYAIQRLKGISYRTIPSKKYEFFVPCGKCLYCRLQRRKEWCLRLIHENSKYEKSSFVTLTYADEHLHYTKDGGLSLYKKDLQDFFKKIRKTGKKIKYYACGEYGEPERTLPNGYITEGDRPHYHALIFGLDHSDYGKEIKLGKSYVRKQIIKSSWKYGRTHSGSVTPDSIRYVAQYIDKKIYGKGAEIHYKGRMPEFQYQSQGLGLNYLIDNLDQIVEDGYITYNGKENTIPRYYLKKMKEKLLTTEQWEQFDTQRRKKAKFKNLDINLAILEKDTKEYHLLSLEDKETVRKSLITQGKQVEQTLKDKARLYNARRKKL